MLIAHVLRKLHESIFSIEILLIEAQKLREDKCSFPPDCLTIKMFTELKSLYLEDLQLRSPRTVKCAKSLEMYLWDRLHDLAWRDVNLLYREAYSIVALVLAISAVGDLLPLPEPASVLVSSSISLGSRDGLVDIYRLADMGTYMCHAVLAGRWFM